MADRSVGYGSPPEHSQFKKGQSGNPYGRPRGSTNRRTILEKIMTEKASYREGETVTIVTKMELLLRTIRFQAAEGNIVALDLLEKLSGHFDHKMEGGPRAILICKRKMTHEEWEAKYGTVDNPVPPESRG